jgi:hypothetical protein
MSMGGTCAGLVEDRAALALDFLLDAGVSMLYESRVGSALGTRALGRLDAGVEMLLLSMLGSMMCRADLRGVAMLNI